MTFRHTRAGGNVLQVGTDRISTAGRLESFQTLLKTRGTGELARIDVDLLRLGAEFIEYEEVISHLETIETDLMQQLQSAQAAGRGRNAIKRLENHLTAVRNAQSYVRTFREGHGVGSIPSRAVSEVSGISVADAALREARFLRSLQILRYGGRVFLVAGAALSIKRVFDAPPEQTGRVAAEEAGGWAFSLAGAAAGAEGGALLGAALGIETGPGAIISGAIGGVIGGAAGFIGGEASVNKAFGHFAQDGPNKEEDPTRFLPDDDQFFYPMFF